MTVQIGGRLALRTEGNNWNAYWAPRQDSMEGAMFIASVNMQLVSSEKRRKEWRLLVQEMFGDMIEEHVGVRPTWPEPVMAPEHERTSNA
jgi:hypothetical protein